MSKNIKLIAGAGLAVAAASTASVFNASAISVADLITEYEGDTTVDQIQIATTEATNYQSLGDLEATNGRIYTSRRINGAGEVTDLYVDVYGAANLTGAFSTISGTAKIHLNIKPGAIVTLGDALTVKAGTTVENAGTIYMNTAAVMKDNSVIKNSGTIYVNDAFTVPAGANFINNGTLNVEVQNGLTVSGDLTNNGTIFVDDGAEMVVNANGYLYNNKTVKVLGELTLPGNATHATGIYTIDARLSTDTAGLINSPVDLRSRLVIPGANRAGTARATVEGYGVNGVTYSVVRAANVAAGTYTVTIDGTVVENTVSITADDNVLNGADDPEDVVIRNNNTKLIEAIRAAFDHNQDVVAYLRDCGIEIEDLTTADIAYLVSQSGLQDEHGYDYNYFEGWYTDAHYDTKANTQALVKKDEHLYAKLSVRDWVHVLIGDNKDVFNMFDPLDFDTQEAYNRAIRAYTVFAKQGATYGQIKPQIVAMLTAFNKANGTNYTLNDIYFVVDRNKHPELHTIGFNIEGIDTRVVRLDQILNMTVEDDDIVYIRVGKNAVKPAAATSTKPGAGATLASVKAPSTGVASEATGSASSSNIFATLAGAVVALGAAVAKLFKKSER